MKRTTKILFSSAVTVLVLIGFADVAFADDAQTKLQGLASNYGLIALGAGFGIGLAALGGGIGQGPDGYEGHVTFYVEVPSVEEALSKAESLGGSRVMGPETIMGRMVLGQFKDPEGNVTGLIEGGE